VGFVMEITVDHVLFALWVLFVVVIIAILCMMIALAVLTWNGMYSNYTYSDGVFRFQADTTRLRGGNMTVVVKLRYRSNVHIDEVPTSNSIGEIVRDTLSASTELPEDTSLDILAQTVTNRTYKKYKSYITGVSVSVQNASQSASQTKGATMSPVSENMHTEYVTLTLDD